MDGTGRLRAVARAATATAFAGMGALHFTERGARTMRAMIPAALRRPGVPSPAALVAITGACEIAGAAGLLVPATRRVTGVALVAFLAAVFPANAEAARHPDRFGALAVPFAPRLAAQVAMAALVAWVAAADRAAEPRVRRRGAPPRPGGRSGARR